ncbi:MAG TPA: type II 3-dehydroquinate dehydratase [Firmicutes bacterium]|nr:type II 3-dehydroquinate dehydratase [Bacillota bacterium]
MAIQGRTILFVSGPNLRLLGKRDTHIYGTETLDQIEGWIIQEAQKFDIDVHCYQSESEGDILSFLQTYGPDAQGVIINPGALTHYSYALRDCIQYLKCPVVEVHLSNLFRREEFRHKSVVAPACTGQVTGLGKLGYLAALLFLVDRMR